MNDDLQGSYELLQTMPRIGLGAFVNDQAEQTVNRLVEFFNQGGRLIEVSELFANYHLVWKALTQCTINREEIFIIVKIWPQSQTPSALEERIVEFVKNSKFMYIDILLAHAPIDMENRFEQWTALENIKRKGLAKTLALANMSLNQLMTVIKNATLLPAFFQTELSPFTPQRDLAEYCIAGNIPLINSEPCCKGIKNHNAKLGDLCAKLVMSPEQVLFRWSVTKGYISLIPANTGKSVGLNPRILEAPLDKDVMRELEGWEEEGGTIWAPIVDEDS